MYEALKNYYITNLKLLEKYLGKRIFSLIYHRTVEEVRVERTSLKKYHPELVVQDQPSQVLSISKYGDYNLSVCK